MSIAVVQVVGVSGTGSAITSVTTAGITTTTANLVILNGQKLTYVTAGAPTFSDSNSNSWAAESIAVTTYGSVTKADYRERYNANITGGASHTFTLNGGGINSYPVLIATEVSGHAASPLDQVATATNTSSTTHTSASTATTSQNNELLHGCGMDDFGVTGATHSVSAPWTQDFEKNEVAAGGTPGGISASQIVAATGTYSFTYTTDTNTNLYLSTISTWKEAAGGGSSIVPIVDRQYRTRWAA